MQADEAGDEDGVGELDCAAEAGGWVDPVCCWVREMGLFGWEGVCLHRGSMVGWDCE